MKKALSATALALAVTFSFSSFIFPISASAAPALDIWWPINGANVSGEQPFKAMLENTDVGQYSMTWSVDGGRQNQMYENDTDAPHYESDVDLTNWNWHGAGPYTVTFTAVENGQTVANQTVDIMVGNGSVQSATSAQTLNQTPATQTPQAAATTQGTLDMWWPIAGATLSGVQPFKALVPGLDPNSYSMSWSVDGGQENMMQTNDTDGAHKEASVDVSNWNWHGAGPYELTFTATDNSGNVIATDSFPIYLPGASAPAPAAQSNSPTFTSAPAMQTPNSINIVANPVVSGDANAGDPLAGLSFYADPGSEAATAPSSSDAATAEATQLLAQTPGGIWLGAWDGNVETTIASTMQAAETKGQTPLFVAYNIPDRDCGGYSAGGAEDDASYNAWIQQVAQGIGSGSAVVVLEPDSLSSTSCLSPSQLSDRETLLSSAVSTLKTNPNTKVYIDAGHEDWIDPATMASELEQAGVAKADGFATNVSNFMPTAGEEAYGAQVSQALGGTHFVIDTSRNGAGDASGEWCNPSGTAIGASPTTNTGDALVDAFLWVKPPGESDGTCNGGPAAGAWWPDSALSLVANAGK